MKMYLVNLASLPISERSAAIERIGALAWDIYEKYENGCLTAVKVAWDRQEDFQSSPVYPSGCPCRLLVG